LERKKYKNFKKETLTYSLWRTHLGKEKNTRILKKKHLLTVFGELTLEEAIDM